MNSTPSNQPSEKVKEIIAELKTEYLYIAIPFIILVIIKLHKGSWQDIFLSGDWALASCIIFGQTATRLSKAIAKQKAKLNNSEYGWYTAKRIFLVVISVVVYSLMTLDPKPWVAVFQLILFAIATYFHFKDGIAARLIEPS